MKEITVFDSNPDSLLTFSKVHKGNSDLNPNSVWLPSLCISILEVSLLLPFLPPSPTPPTEACANAAGRSNPAVLFCENLDAMILVCGCDSVLLVDAAAVKSLHTWYNGEICCSGWRRGSRAGRGDPEPCCEVRAEGCGGSDGNGTRTSSETCGGPLGRNGVRRSQRCSDSTPIGHSGNPRVCVLSFRVCLSFRLAVSVSVCDCPFCVYVCVSFCVCSLCGAFCVLWCGVWRVGVVVVVCVGSGLSVYDSVHGDVAS